MILSMSPIPSHDTSAFADGHARSVLSKGAHGVRWNSKPKRLVSADASKAEATSKPVHQDPCQFNHPALLRRKVRRNADFLSVGLEQRCLERQYSLEAPLRHRFGEGCHSLESLHAHRREDDVFVQRYGGRLLGGMNSNGSSNPDGDHAPQDSQMNSPVLMLNCLILGLSAAVQGYDHGAASGALHNLITFKELQGQGGFGPLLEGWVVASAWVSTILGNLGGYYMPAPRLVLVLAAALETCGSLLTGLAPTLHILILGRLLNGFGLGLNGVALAQYVSEIAPPDVRGGAIACQETTFVSGALLGAIAGQRWYSAKGGWRKSWGFASVLGLLAFVTMLRMPDTPRSIYRTAARKELAGSAERPPESPEAAQRRRLAALEAARRDALDAMCTLRGLAAPDAALLRELEGIEHTYAADLQLQGSAQSSGSRSHEEELSLTEILSSGVHRRLLIAGCVVNLFPAMAGHVALLTYAGQMFQLVGFGFDNAASIAVGMYALKLATTLPDFLWLDAFGRRVLLSYGLTGVLGCYAIAISSVQMHGAWMASFALLAAATSYQCAVGPVTWIVSSEVYPSDMRTRGCALAAVTYSTSSLVSVQFHPLLMRSGPTSVFAVYGLTTAVAWGLARVLVPETKGRSLEEIEHDAFSGRLFRRTSIVEARSMLGLSPEPDAAG
eukprot:TRINITY_DN66293_c0_g1_i1.p1 TRINITY_DN66293_c0_g1~~TRINITY_DN66293_c0_g1_i1.p1  ORF type:complete len:670 (+),score=110.82 TRINITY_DN66293_c0_g1_i1:16-2025(+)